MNIEDIRTLRLAAEFGSFSKAAEHLMVTQPAVSQRIRHLERELGVELFSRNGRRVMLSDAGEVVLDFARELDGLLMGMRQRLASTTANSHSVVVGASAATVGYILPALYEALYERQPRARVRTVVLPPEQVRAGLQRGELDFAVLARMHVTDDLVAEPMIMQRLLLVGHPKHPLTRETSPVPMETLAREPWITATMATQTRQLVRDWARAAGTVPRIVMEVDSHDGIATAVKRGIGIGFVIESVAAEDLRAGKLAVIPAPGVIPDLSIALALNPSYPLSDGARALLETMRTTDWREHIPRLG